MHRKNDKQVWVGIPEWLKEIDDSDVFATITAMLFEWGYSGMEDIVDFKKYIENFAPDLKPEQVNRIAELLIEHKIVEPQEP